MADVEVLVIGRNCLDHISLIETYPREDSKAPLARRIIEGGGQGGTSACCISKLGGRVAYVGRIGDDLEGRTCLQRLAAFGVNTEFIDVVKAEKTPIAYVFVTKSSGKRTIIYEPNRLPPLTMEDILPGLVCLPKILLLDPEVTYLAKPLKTQTSGAIQIVYDCERWRKGLTEMMALADFFIPSADFLESKELGLGNLTFGERVAELRRVVTGKLVVTSGDQGAFYFHENTLYQVRPPEIDVLDTTGAGDNFHAAFSLSVARGLDMHVSVRFAVAVASLSCREYGGRNGIPHMDEAAGVAGRLKTLQA